MEKLQKKDRINIILKPTNYCNMRCIYCFHQEYGYENNLIKLEYITKLFDLLSRQYYTVFILWHGGEPTSIGLDNFKKYISIQKEFARKNNAIFENSIQTNLTNINDEWLAFFKDNYFNIGTSFDGLSNDITRKNTALFLDKRKKTLEFGYKIGAICVISKKNIHSLLENYKWFNANSFSVNFNPYITADSSDFLYVDRQTYADEMLKMFEYWIDDTDCCIHVNPFENLIYAYFKQEFRVCTFGSCLSHWLCIEPNGNIFPCDKSFDENYCLGNISNIEKIEDVYNSNSFLSILKESIKRRNLCISSCKWFKYCHGGCNHDAFICGDISKNNHYYCLIYKDFFQYIETYVKPKLEKEIVKNPILRSILYNLDSIPFKNSNA